MTGTPPTAHEWGTAPDFVGPRHELRERLLLDLFLGSRPGRRVLNVGAGQGSFTLLLEEHGFHVVSTDISSSALSVLSRRVEGTTLLADMTDLPLADASFDAVIAGEVLEHVENDAGALREAARVLRPGGVLALSVPAHPTWFGPSDRWAGHVRRYSRDALTRAIAQSGLELERVRPWGFPMSALYHRAVFDGRAERLASDDREHRLGKTILRAVLTVDRLFVGVERGCLGYLALARAGAGNVSASSSERH